MNEERTGLSKSSLARTAVAIAVAVMAVNLATRGLAVGPFQIPAAALPLVPLIMASVGASLGPAFGYYMSFRHPKPDSMKWFLIPCVALTFVGIGIEVVRFGTGHRNTGALFVGASQGIVAIGLALLVLLSVDSKDQKAARLLP